MSMERKLQGVALSVEKARDVVWMWRSFRWCTAKITHRMNQGAPPELWVTEAAVYNALAMARRGRRR